MRWHNRLALEREEGLAGDRRHEAGMEGTKMADLSAWHIAIVAAVFVVLFGSAKLPDVARSLGQALRIFKAETKGLPSDDETSPRSPRPRQDTPGPQPRRLW